MTPLVYLSLAWVTGIWLGRLLAFPTAAWAAGALVTILGAVLIRPRNTRFLIVCVAALALGGTRLTLAETKADDFSLANFNGQGKVTLVGVVADEPDVRSSFVFYKLDAESLRLDDGVEKPIAVHGAARVRGPRFPVYRYGDRLLVRGELEQPSILGDFDYPDYLARRGIHSQISFAQVERLSSGSGSAWKRAMLDIKNRAQGTIRRILPEPEASLLTGILLGVEGGIALDLYDDFKATGASHVIVISGFNITIVVALLMATVTRVVPDRRMAAGIAILGVVAYTLLVGADAAVVRAAIMGIIVVLGVIVGRQGLAHNTLAAAVLVMTALNPFTLWSVGFQLSVAATLGLIVYGERFERVAQRVLERWLPAERAKGAVHWLSEMLLLTLAAQIVTAPLILYHFGQFSTVSLLTNALILPVQPLVMFTGGAATLVGLVFEPLGQLLGWAAYLWLTWTIRVVEWTARFPYASVPFKLSDAGFVAVYAAIIGVTTLVLLSPERRRALWESVHVQLPFKAAVGGLALATAAIWFAVLQLPDGKLRVAFLDVGQGDAIFVKTPGGAQILVDGGPAASTLLAELGRQMPFWDRTLDLVVLTHPDTDHLTGLIAALERYAVSAVVYRDDLEKAGLAEEWETALAGEGAKLIRGAAGMRIELDEGVTIEVLHPGPELSGAGADNTNDNSIVLRLVYKDVAILLPGDIGEDVERELVRSGAYLSSTVLKVPHHGSKTSSSEGFLAAVNPQVVVISVGEDNWHGFPSPAVLERLEGTKLYRTDENGTVTIASDGHTLWIETER